MKHMFAVSLYIWVATGALYAGAQPPNRSIDVKRLDEIASYYTRRGSFMGTVLVADGNNILLNKGYGYADLEWKIPQQPDAAFHLASVSKQFTAAAVLLLQQDGKLRVTEPISRYLPDTPESWRSLTVENLLNHTSGLEDFTEDPRFAVWSMSPQSVQQQFAFVHDYTVAFEPGSKFVYCNTNYLLLSMIVEAISGMRFRDFLQQRIFSQFGMVHTGTDTDALVLPHRARGYKQGKDGLERVREVSFSVSSVDGGGGLYSTTGDLLLWEQALFGGKVLNEGSLAFMTRNGLGNYGAGLFHDERHGETVIEHSGAIDGFATDVSYLPRRRITVVVLSNREHSTKGLIAGQLLDVMLGDPVVLGDEPSPPISSVELQRLVGSYVFPSSAPDDPIELSVRGHTLFVAQGKAPAGAAIYEGRTGDRFRFTVPDLDAEIQIDSRKQPSTMNFHWDWDHAVTKRSEIMR